MMEQVIGDAVQLEHEARDHHKQTWSERGRLNWRICQQEMCLRFQTVLNGNRLTVPLSNNIRSQTPPRRRGTIVLDRATCDWVIDEEADTAICRTHGEVADGVRSKHFPGWFWQQESIYCHLCGRRHPPPRCE